jgi:hypothetical protein
MEGAARGGQGLLDALGVAACPAASARMQPFCAPCRAAGVSWRVSMPAMATAPSARR